MKKHWSRTPDLKGSLRGKHFPSSKLRSSEYNFGGDRTEQSVVRREGAEPPTGREATSQGFDSPTGYHRIHKNR
jgi:hypothetical protein